MDLEVFETATKYIENNIGQNNLLVQKVSEYTNYSIRHLDRIFESYAECTVTRYIRKRKISLALSEAAIKKLPINLIANRHNFDAASFTRATKSEYGITPKKYLKQGDPAELFPPSNVEELKKCINEVTPLMDSLAEKGLIKYRFKGKDIAFTCKPAMFETASQYLRTLPAVPLPVQLLENIHDYDQLSTVLGLSLYEFKLCQFDLDKMEWNTDNWDKWCENLSDDLIMAIDAINFWYSLDSAYAQEGSNIVWFRVDSLKTKKMHLIAAGDKMNKKPYSIKMTKDEFAILLESAHTVGLTCYTGRSGSDDVYIEFIPSKLLAYIKEISREVYVPAAGFENLASNSRAMLVLFGSKLPSFHGKVNFGVDELPVKLFIVRNFYNIESPVLIGNQLKVEANEFIIDVLESLIEVSEVCGEEFKKNLDYTVKEVSKEEFELKLNDIFVTMALEDGII